MYNFYADDNYLKADRDDPQPRVYLFGGILISYEDEINLIKIIKDEKKKYTHENLPVKWNFKDKAVTNAYKEFHKYNEYKNMLANSREIRLNIAKKSLEIDYKIIISCIKSYSKNKKVIKENKDTNIQYLFENLVFRLGNEADSNKSHYQIILDWPANNDPSIFNRPYYYLFNSKKTITGGTNYCGPLSEKNFAHSLLFTKCTHSPCMQFTDFVIGAFKDYLEMDIKSNNSCVGKEYISIIKPKFRKSKYNKITGYGIVVSSGNNDMKNQITRLFDD